MKCSPRVRRSWWPRATTRSRPPVTRRATAPGSSPWGRWTATAARRAIRTSAAALALCAPGGKAVSDFVAGDTTANQWVASTANQGTTSPSGNNAHYAEVFGTSIAAAQVTGIASLILSVNPSLAPQFVKEILRNTSRAFPIRYSSARIAGGLHHRTLRCGNLRGSSLRRCGDFLGCSHIHGHPGDGLAL